MSTRGARTIAAGEGLETLDESAFADHYRSAYAALRVVASGEVGESAADDVVQEAALVAMARLDRFTPGTNFRAWMAAMVRGVARNHRRSERRRERRHANLRHRTTRARDADASPSLPIANPTASETLVDDFDERLRAAVNDLPSKQRTCLLLRAVHACSYTEISALVQIPESTARSCVHRARQSLFDSLGGPPEKRSNDG